MLPSHFVPSSVDVICQKGQQAYNHPGNVRFRLIVSLNVERYGVAPNKASKSVIVNEIVDLIRENNPSGGGFVRHDKDTNHWYEIGDAMAREKVGFSIREELRKRDPVYMEAKRRKRRNTKRQRTAARKQNEMRAITAAIKETDKMIRDADEAPAGAPTQPSVLASDLGLPNSDSFAEEGELPMRLQSLGDVKMLAGPVDTVKSLWDEQAVVPKTKLTMGESREWFSDDQMKRMQVVTDDFDFSALFEGGERRPRSGYNLAQAA